MYNQKCNGDYQLSKKEITDIYEKIDVFSFFENKNNVVMDYIVTNTIKNFPLQIDNHINSEVNICFDGEAIVGTGEIKKKVSKGSVILVNSGANHGFSSKDGASFYIIGFSNLEFKIDANSILVCDDIDIEKMCNLIETMKYYARNKNTSNELIESLTTAFLKMVAFETSTVNAHYTPDNGSLLTSRIADYINKNFKSDITIDFLAKKFGCSRSTLIHSFKKDYGISVMNYLRKRRLKEILFWLSISNRSVVELANEHGFDTMSYFFKYFKKEVGMTPKEYRSYIKKEKSKQI